MALERAVLRPLLGQPAFTVVMVTIGIGYLARGLVTMIPEWGTDTHVLPVPYRDEIVSVGGSDGLILSMEHIVIIAVTAALIAGLYLLFKHTKIGIAMQATSQNQLAAFYMGIPVRRINMLVWGLSAAISACPITNALRRWRRARGSTRPIGRKTNWEAPGWAMRA